MLTLVYFKSHKISVMQNNTLKDTTSSVTPTSARRENSGDAAAHRSAGAQRSDARQGAPGSPAVDAEVTKPAAGLAPQLCILRTPNTEPTLLPSSHFLNPTTAGHPTWDVPKAPQILQHLKLSPSPPMSHLSWRPFHPLGHNSGSGGHPKACLTHSSHTSAEDAVTLHPSVPHQPCHCWANVALGLCVFSTHFTAQQAAQAGSHLSLS